MWCEGIRWGRLTATCVVGVVVGRTRDGGALVVTSVVLPLQPQCQRQSAQCGCHAHALADTGFLLAHRPVRPGGALAVPATATGSCGAARVVVVFDVGGLFVGVLALLAANAQDAEQSVEEGASAAEEAEEQQEEDTEDHTNYDSCDGTAGETRGGFGFGE